MSGRVVQCLKPDSGVDLQFASPVLGPEGTFSKGCVTFALRVMHMQYAGKARIVDLHVRPASIAAWPRPRAVGATLPQTKMNKKRALKFPPWAGAEGRVSKAAVDNQSAKNVSFVGINR
ncbi:hypothetical protein O181_027735 [Austropuccinia psidii MF-1]|uniref:Uncharacterized protein n=1 Tax=Austropuccinia psidii MF-1 TaxID=1389203 RepID=A0A9Q3H3H7_9BASI|nr:hypothetical protein [Austropuccinia psidii MF-1]